LKFAEARFFGGLSLPTYKALSRDADSVLVPLPERITLPLQQHIGLPAKPMVRVGEQVYKGQPIAQPDRYVSVPLHASTSGKVIDIGDYPVPDPAARSEPCIVIEPDGDDRWYDIRPTPAYDQVSPARMQELIRECGIVGLGGAGFPTHVKIREGEENAVDTLIINGAECEPYITCDDRLVREKASYVVAGTRMIAHAVQARRSIIAVEKDMPEAAALEQELDGQELGGEIDLIAVAARYPAGGEKQLGQTLTGREVPSGGLSIHVRVMVQNVATAAAVYRAVTRGEPVVSRYLTVTGDVARPRNLQVLLGTPVVDCLRMCDQRPLEESREVICGGPMMGSPMHDVRVPVTKTINCILVQEARPRLEEQPCIRCGRCVEVCPVRLLPQELHRLTRMDALESAREQHLFDCIECGCCAYVCPSHIPLVKYYREAKRAIADWERQREGADRARKRFLAREERRQREQEQSLGPRPPASLQRRRAYVQEAAERSRARRRRQDAEDEGGAPENGPGSAPENGSESGPESGPGSGN